MNEASGQNDLLQGTDPQPKLESRKQTWLIRIAIDVAIAIAGWFWLNPPLNSEEQKLVGRWERIREYSDGRRSKLIISYNSDREWILANIIGTLSVNGQPAIIDAYGAFEKWKVKNGNLRLDSNRSLEERTEFLIHRAGNLIRVKKSFDGHLSEGRVRFLSPSEMQIQWHDSSKKILYKEKYYREFEDNNWKRVE